MTDKAPRRWKQISLRSMLLLMLTVCVYFAGWVAGHRAGQRSTPKLGVSFADLDNDGMIDLYISNDGTSVQNVKLGDATFSSQP